MSPTTGGVVTAPAHPGLDLPGLTSLRAAAALLVLLYHLTFWGVLDVPGTDAGYAGVGLFFVLSGFVLTWSARPGQSHAGFLWRRFARIYPNHLVTFVAAVVFCLAVGALVTPGLVVADLLLVQAWSPSGETAMSINNVAWSLSCEAAFYVAFPFLLRGLTALRPTPRTTVALAAVAAPLVVGLVWPGLAPWFYHLPLTRAPEFVLGIVAALAVQEGWRPRVGPTVGGILVLGAVVLAGLLAPGTLGTGTLVVTAGLAVPFALLVAAFAAHDLDGPRGWTAHPWLVLAGAVSYAFYLVHELVVRGFVVLGGTGPVAAAGVLLLASAGAYGLYRLVEVPSRRRLLGFRRRDSARRYPAS
jgi:peptidoglycan/LPS O-acetylase OafA/YrhL